MTPNTDPNVTIRAILQQPEFHVARHAGGELPIFAWLRAFGHWVGELIHRLLTGAPGLSHVPEDAVTTVLMGIGFSAMACAAYVLATRLGRRVPKGWSTQQERLASLRLDDEAALRRRAEDAAVTGDYRRAIALLFQAAIMLLDRLAIMRLDPARTPREYRAGVRKHCRPAAQPFDQLAARFVHASFAASVPVRGDYEVAERAYAAFEPTVAPA